MDPLWFPANFAYELPSDIPKDALIERNLKGSIEVGWNPQQPEQ